MIVSRAATAWRNTAWLLLEKLAAMGLSLLVTLVMARHLAPAQFGELSYLLAIIAIVTPLSALGLNAIVTRELVRRPEDEAVLLGTVLGLRLGGTLICGLIAWLLSFLFLSPNQHGQLLWLLLANLFTAATVVDFWLQAKVANRFSALARSSALLLCSLGRLLAVALDAPLPVFIWLAALEMALVGLFFLWILAWRYQGRRPLIWRLSEAVSLLKQSLWLLVSAFAAIIYLKIDQVMLANLVSSAEVGQYAVASRISEVWYFFPSALVISFFPRLLQTRDHQPQRYALELQKLNDGLFAAALLLAMLMQLAAGPLIRILFGEAFMPAVPVLLVHIWAGIFIFMRELLSKWLIAEHLLRFSLLTQIAGAVINILLNFWLIPIMGAVGAAWATVLSYATASYLALFLHKQTWGMARIMTLSLLLPLRLLRSGRAIYK